MESQTFWKKCSSCKREIGFSQTYYLCSVSTCRHSRTGLRFCSIGCWDAHLAYANHRSSHAEEARAPSAQEFAREGGVAQSASTAASSASAPDRSVKRTIIEDNKPPATGVGAAGGVPPKAAPADVETLVVVSRVKAYITSLSEFNTSQCCIDALTQKIVNECKKGIERAKAAGRKTVMGRDIV